MFTITDVRMCYFCTAQNIRYFDLKICTILHYNIVYHVDLIPIFLKLQNSSTFEFFNKELHLWFFRPEAVSICLSNYVTMCTGPDFGPRALNQIEDQETDGRGCF
jgi:hypothetical protein